MSRRFIRHQQHCFSDKAEQVSENIKLTLLPNLITPLFRKLASGPCANFHFFFFFYCAFFHVSLWQPLRSLKVFVSFPESTQAIYF